MTTKLICRTCLEITEENNYVHLNILEDVGEHKSLGQLLEECVSEICLQLTESPIICNECNAMLKKTYQFKKLCCETEERIYDYMKLNNLHLGKCSNLDLFEVKKLQHPLETSVNYNDQKQINISENSDQPVTVSSRPKREASINKNLLVNEQILESFSTDSDRSTDLSSDDSSEQSSNEFKEKHSQSRRFKCQKCNYKAYRIDLLKRHKSKCKNRLKKKEEIYDKVCKYCQKKFNRNTHLKRHEYTHTMVSSHVCKECGQSFAENYQLLNHKIKHTNKEGPYSCNHCEKKFFRKCDLTAHIRRTVLKEVKFKCSHCDKEFHDKRDQISHMSRYHTSEVLPYKCKKCSYSTAYSKRFSTHKKKCI